MTKRRSRCSHSFSENISVGLQPLLDRVAQKAETDFYRGLAVVTQQLIKELAG